MADLVAEQGYSAVTLEQVVARAGTTKPAFYRRFRSLAEVVPQILEARHDTDEDIDTGSLVSDLAEIQRRQWALFTDPVVTRGLVGWLAHIETHPEGATAFFQEYLAPRRAYTEVILGRALARGEIAHLGHPAWVADVLTGPLIMRTLIPGMPDIDAILIRHSVHAALDTVGFSGSRVALENELNPCRY